MQRLFMLMIFIFVLVVCISILMLTAGKKEAVKLEQINEESKSEAPYKRIPKTGLSPQGPQGSKEAVHKEIEYAIQEMPIEEAKAIEEKVKKESADEAKTEGQDRSTPLNTQPSSNELEELKVRGAVIY